MTTSKRPQRQRKCDWSMLEDDQPITCGRRAVDRGRCDRHPRPKRRKTRERWIVRHRASGAEYVLTGDWLSEQFRKRPDLYDVRLYREVARRERRKK